jgi:hypothetical protein
MARRRYNHKSDLPEIRIFGTLPPAPDDEFDLSPGARESKPAGAFPRTRNQNLKLGIVAPGDGVPANVRLLVRNGRNNNWVEVQAGGAVDPLVLPAPHVTLLSPSSSRATPGIINLSETANSNPLTWRNWPEVVALNLGQGLLAASLDLRLELLWFSPGRNGPGVSRRGPQAMKHPANSPAPGGNVGGSSTHGGSTNNSNIPAISEWPITVNGQVVPVDLGPFFKTVNARYRSFVPPSTSDISTTVLVTTPRNTVQTEAFATTSTSVGYSRRVRPGYFAFRYSVRDTDGRRRLTGPMSAIIAVTTELHPFILDETGTIAQGGISHWALRPGFDASIMRCQFGKVQGR